MNFAQWPKTALHAGFPYTNMPAYTILPMLPCLVYARPITVILAFTATIFVWYMTRKGRTLMWLLNRIRGRMRGNRQSARPVWHIRRTCLRSNPVR